MALNTFVNAYFFLVVQVVLAGKFVYGWLISYILYIRKSLVLLVDLTGGLFICSFVHLFVCFSFLDSFRLCSAQLGSAQLREREK